MGGPGSGSHGERHGDVAPDVIGGGVGVHLGDDPGRRVVRQDGHLVRVRVRGMGTGTGRVK